MRFETYIALRYLRGKRKSRLLSLITLIAVAGVAVGVMALVVVMSVVSGFEQAFTEAIIGNRAHITVQTQGATIGAPDAFIERLESVVPEVVAASPVSQSEALLRNPGVKKAQSGGFVLGINPARDQQVTCLADNLTRTGGRTHGEGRLPGSGEIVLGYRLAEKLEARIGTRIKVATDRSQGVSLVVCGIAQARLADLDSYYAFATIETVSRLTGQDGAQAIQCKVRDPMLASAVARKIEDALGVEAFTWHESQREFFVMLQQNKSILFIILVFIVLVASFNIASTLIMMVIEKRQDIGVLRTIGVSGQAVLLIFILEGLLIGLVGTAIGVAAGSLIALNIDPISQGIAWLMGLGSFRAEIYQLDTLPAAIDPGDIAVIAACATVLTFISTIYPAWSASRLDPIDALRRE
ncbi:MAG TPA: ABC transporter permease [Candidatus Bathyarchaeia archaeon]|nr:ABC transporter permease [Candidatus Bathyarchaeia archaeon]